MTNRHQIAKNLVESLDEKSVGDIIKWGSKVYKKDSDGRFKLVDKKTGDIREDLKAKE